MKKIKSGELFLITSGEYSDFNICTICMAKADINVEAEKELYLSSRPKEREDYCFDKYSFIKWLIVDRDIANEVDCKQWHLESYSSVDAMRLARISHGLQKEGEDSEG